MTTLKESPATDDSAADLTQMQELITKYPYEARLFINRIDDETCRKCRCSRRAIRAYQNAYTQRWTAVCLICRFVPEEKGARTIDVEEVPADALWDVVPAR